MLCRFGGGVIGGELTMQDGKDGKGVAAPAALCGRLLRGSDARCRPAVQASSWRMTMDQEFRALLSEQSPQPRCVAPAPNADDLGIAFVAIEHIAEEQSADRPHAQECLDGKARADADDGVSIPGKMTAAEEVNIDQVHGWKHPSHVHRSEDRRPRAASPDRILVDLGPTQNVSVAESHAVFRARQARSDLRRFGRQSKHGRHRKTAGGRHPLFIVQCRCSRVDPAHVGRYEQAHRPGPELD